MNGGFEGHPSRIALSRQRARAAIEVPGKAKLPLTLELALGAVGLTPADLYAFWVIMVWSVIVSILVFRRSAAPSAPAAGDADVSGQTA